MTIEKKGKAINEIYFRKFDEKHFDVVSAATQKLEDEQKTNNVYSEIPEQNILEQIDLLSILRERTGLSDDEILNCLSTLINKSKVAYSAANRTYYKDSKIIS